MVLGSGLTGIGILENEFWDIDELILRVGFEIMKIVIKIMGYWFEWNKWGNEMKKWSDLMGKWKNGNKNEIP